MTTDPDFIPKRRLLQAVTNAEQPTFTTTEDHEYNVGDLVRIIVPSEYGMNIDYKNVTILSVPTSATFTADLDTSALFAFTVPSAPYTEAHVVPIAGQATDNIAG